LVAGAHAEEIVKPREGQRPEERDIRVLGPNDFLRAPDVAYLCGVDLKTIHNWTKKNAIPHERTAGRHLRFRPLDVAHFLRDYGYAIPEVLRQVKPQVIVAHEDAAFLAAVRRALAKRFIVGAFGDVFEALVAIGRTRPDAVVFDVALGGVDVLRCVERLKASALTRTMRVFVSSDAMDDEEMALAAGADALFPSGDPAELRDAIEQALAL
jgi:PleD family two-component response regulator